MGKSWAIPFPQVGVLAQSRPDVVARQRTLPYVTEHPTTDC